MLLSVWPNFWEDWQLYHKVTFDGVNKLIIVNHGVASIDMQIDVYSAWKEWTEVRDNSKYEQAIRSIGGDPTVAGNFIGPTFFLMNGWKMKTWEGDHRLIVNGNVYCDDGTEQFVIQQGKYQTLINIVVSNIIDIPASASMADLAERVWTYASGSGDAKQKILDDTLKFTKVIFVSR